jgi:rubrerythrin
VIDAKAKDLLLFLAEEEAKHVGDFERILAGLGEYHSPESYPGEYEEYLKALVENHVFHKGLNFEDLAPQMADAGKAIDMALRFEKDSILFFNEMKNFVPQGEHEAIDKLIAQEREHIKKLSQMKKEL